MTRTRITAALCGLVLLAAGAARAGDEIWVWTTADGRVHYTDDLEHVPPAYRDAARVARREGGGSYQRVRSAPATAPAKPAAPAASPAPHVKAAETEAEREGRWRAEAKAVDARIAALGPEAGRCAHDHINRSPGDGGRKRREEREEAERCAKTRADLAAALEERADLEERARHEDVPPGWLRNDE